MPDVISNLEAIRDANLVGIGNLRTWARFNEEHATAALEILNGCTRAWRDTANGKEWFLLVPIDTPE